MTKNLKLKTINKTNLQEDVAEAFRKVLNQDGYAEFEMQAAKVIAGLSYAIHHNRGPDRLNEILDAVPMAVEKAMANVRRFQIIPVDVAEPIISRTVGLSEKPHPREVQRAIDPFLNAPELRVGVIIDGEMNDMFIDDLGYEKELPRNERATELYRADYLAKHLGVDPESLPAIHGPAVLFDGQVWF